MFNKVVEAMTWAEHGEAILSWVAGADVWSSTEPADFDAATKAALRGYELVGLKKPPFVRRYTSPLDAVGGSLAPRQSYALRWNDENNYLSSGSMLTQLRDNVWEKLRADCRYIDEEGRDSSMWAFLSLRGNAPAVWHGIWQSVFDIYPYWRARRLSDPPGRVRSMSGLAPEWGVDELIFTYLRDVVGIEFPADILEKIGVLETLFKSCGWAWAARDFLLMSDRPCEIRLDQQRRPHAEKGASITWRNGRRFYHWHGVMIPCEWVTGKPPSAKEALTRENIEQRRAACEIVGWNNILSELNARVIDEDVDEEIGALLEVTFPEVQRQQGATEKFLRVRCGTGRTFCLPVPRDMQTAIQTNAWTYGLNPEDFQPEVRT